jgi:hypothetical protein
VAKWYSDFKSGRVGTTDNDRSGIRNRATSPENNTPVEMAILDNKRVTVRELERDMGSSITLKADSHIAGRAHAVPLPCRAVNSHMPCRAPALLRQCCVLRESPRGSQKYPNC